MAAGANTVQRSITVTTSYAPLSSLNEVYATMDVSCPPGNTGSVFFLGDDNEDVPWIPGEWHTLSHTDLYSLQIKGTAGDIVTVVGGTR